MLLPTETHEAEVVLLDTDGVIISANDAWWRFCVDNGGDPARVGPGASYLAACDAAAGDASADRVAGAVRAALRDELPAPVTVSVPCHRPDEWRWFDVLVSPRRDEQGRGVGAAVTLSLARSVPVRATPGCSAADPGTALPSGRVDPAEPVRADYREDRCERLGDDFAQAVLDLAPVGILVLDEEGVVLRAGSGADQLFGADPGELVGTDVARLLPVLRRAAGSAGAVVSPVPSGTTRTTGVRRDGVRFAARVVGGPVALTRGTGTLLVVEPVGPDRDGATGRLHSVAVDLEHALDRLLGCSLRLAGVVGRLADGSAVADWATDAMGELDDVVAILRGALVSCRGDREYPPLAPSGE